MSETCTPPSTQIPPGLRFRIRETWDDGSVSYDFLPTSIGYIVEGFGSILEFWSATQPDTTSSGSRKFELMECFVPVRVNYKHYTQSAGTGITTSTDEFVVLDVANQSHTWPQGTTYVPASTDGGWDGDWELEEIV
jgi:hypothetical protein